ncbi:MAG: hypothetical protein WDA25_01130 [Paracoccaceae bacterium]
MIQGDFPFDLQMLIERARIHGVPPDAIITELECAAEALRKPEEEPK